MIFRIHIGPLAALPELDSFTESQRRALVQKLPVRFRIGMHALPAVILVAIGGVGYERFTDVPMLGVMLMIAAPIAAIATRAAIIHRLRQGLRAALKEDEKDHGSIICLGCGYDVSAVEHDACPECGRPVTRPNDSASPRFIDERRRSLRYQATDVVDLTDKFDRIAEHWSPRIVGELNGQHVKVAKFAGPFIWHHHDDADELFYVVRGVLRMQLRMPGQPERELVARKGQFLIVPRGVEHRPIADDECHVMLFEPAGTVNTGTVRNERTVDRPQRI